MTTPINPPDITPDAALSVLVPYTVTNAMLISSTVPEDDAPVWSAATAYAVGATVLRLASHAVYECVLATGVPASLTPENDPEHWLFVRTSNRWSMFDESVGSATQQHAGLNGPMIVKVAIPGPMNNVVLLDVVGQSVTLTTQDGVQRTQEVPGGSAPVVNFFGLDSAGENITLKVQSTNPVSIGSLLVGSFTRLANVVGTAQLGLTDFSRKTFDDYGQPLLVRRGFNRRLSVPIEIPRPQIDGVVNVLASVRSRPVLWRGVPWLASTVLYGWPKSWDLKLETPARATGTITLESLVQTT